MSDVNALTICLANYLDPQDADDLVYLLDIYARDPMGGSSPLVNSVRTALPNALAQEPGAFSLIARQDGEPVGLANCFTHFSTFAASRVINIHDMVVTPENRGKGIARAIFARIEEEAHARDAYKVTLEVLSGNERAKKLYSSLGYGDYMLGTEHGHALFWQKELS